MFSYPKEVISTSFAIHPNKSAHLPKKDFPHKSLILKLNQRLVYWVSLEYNHGNAQSVKIREKMDSENKLTQLNKLIKSFKNAAICFSGGLDSSFLAKCAIDALGSENVIGFIAKGDSLPQWAFEIAKYTAKKIGLNLIVIPTNESQLPEFKNNSPQRCYFCKKYIFSKIIDSANSHGFKNVLCGTNFDDLDDFRPGNRATKELGVLTPLLDCRITKNEIRKLAKQLQLPNAEMPATPCLASRVPYGKKITDEKLNQIEKAEDLLIDFGFEVCRLRHHGNLARIEVPEAQIGLLFKDSNRLQELISGIKKLGFKYVTVDLEGFRSGALNEVLSDDELKKG